MKLTEYAQVTGLRLEVSGTTDAAGRPTWSCSFQGVEIKDGCLLTTTWGRGKSPHAAMKEYCKEIAGKDLVYCAYRHDRRDFKAPAKLSPG